MTTRKRKAQKVKPTRYTITKLSSVRHAREIASLVAEGFSREDDGTRASAFIGVTWWGVFTSSGQLIGVGGMLQSAIEEDTFYLNRSYIQPEHRGHGLQRKLIKARVARAKELKGAFATSDTFNSPHSTNNLLGCGFRAYSPAEPWRGTDGTVYWRVRL
jgi:predicted GNAT family acetyltransferase